VCKNSTRHVREDVPDALPFPIRRDPPSIWNADVAVPKTKEAGNLDVPFCGRFMSERHCCALARASATAGVSGTAREAV